MQKIIDLCKKDEYNFIAPDNREGTLLLCAFSREYEQKNNVKIHFIINPAHEIIMKMYKIENYSFASMKLPETVKIAVKYKYPQKGKPYVAHPFFYDKKLKRNFKRNAAYDLADIYRKLYNLDKKSMPQKPLWYPDLSDKLKEQLSTVASLDKIILISAETSICSYIKKDFWVKKAKSFVKKGYKVVANITNIRGRMENTLNLNLSTSDAIALAMKCHKVYSLRSEFTGMIFEKGKDLTIFYTPTEFLSSRQSKKIYSLNTLWSNNNIKEEVKESSIFFKKNFSRKNTALFNKFVIKQKITNCTEIGDKQIFNTKINFLNIPIFRKEEQNDYIKIYILSILIRKTNMAEQKCREMWNKYHNQYDDIYFLASPSGELYLFLNTAQAIIKKYGSKRPLFIVDKPYKKDMCRMFQPDIPCVQEEFPIALYLYEKHIHKINNMKFFLFFPTWYYVMAQDKLIKERLSGKINYYDCILDFVELNRKDNNFHLPIISLDAKKSLQEKIQKLGLNLDKFVFLSPEAISCLHYPQSFWVNLIKKLKELGYDVFLNIMNSNNNIEEAKTCFLSHEEVFALAQLSSGIIGLRSGMIEILSMINVPIHVLYTDMPKRVLIEPMDAENTLHAFTMKKLPGVNVDNIYEYDCNNITEENLLTTILEKFKIKVT